MLDTSSRGREHVVSARTRGRAVNRTDKKERVKRSQRSEVGSNESKTQWTVKGIDKGTLEASRIAARKRGMKFGAWVNEVLLAAANGESSSNSDGAKELLSKIADMESKLDQSVSALRQQNDHIQHDVRILQLLIPKSAAR